MSDVRKVVLAEVISQPYSRRGRKIIYMLVPRAYASHAHAEVILYRRRPLQRNVN